MVERFLEREKELLKLNARLDGKLDEGKPDDANSAKVKTTPAINTKPALKCRGDVVEQERGLEV